LFSKRLKKEVVPKLTNAHNYSANALPVYHFLCDLQQQYAAYYGFRWGSFFTKYNYIPRVVYQDIILARARWNLKKKDVENLIELKDQKKKLMSAINTWKETYSIPQWVQLADGDNTLTINFSNYNSILMFLEAVKKRSSFTLEEFFFSNDSIVKNKDGHYCNQVILSFYKDQEIINNA